MSTPGLYLVESVYTGALPRAAGRSYLEAHGQQLPDVIYPELRVLTAEKPTLNMTYYYESTLRGDPERGTGLSSFTYPYPIPIIRDHLSAPGANGAPASEVYGRVRKPAQFLRSLQDGYVLAMPEITHPEAIEGILSGRWLTISLGSRCQSVRCTICNQEMTEGGCDHVRGETYEVEGTPKTAYWGICELKSKEISFVVTPSDDQAGVLRPNVNESVSTTRSLPRVLVGNSRGVFDLATGARVEESPSLSRSGRRLFSLTESRSPSRKERTMPENQKARSTEEIAARNIPEAYKGEGRYLLMGGLHDHDAYLDKNGDGTSSWAYQTDPFGVFDRQNDTYDYGDNAAEGNHAHEIVGGVVLAGGDTVDNNHTHYIEPAHAGAEAAKDDDPVTLGRLYLLPADHPDFLKPDKGESVQEAVLTTKSRNALPSSAFCGPARSFPGHDKCLPYSQEIALLDGTNCPIGEVVQRLAAGEELWTYGFDREMRSIVPAKITEGRLTERNAPLLKITLDNGEVVRCTANHPFLLRDMTYKRADELEPGESVMPLYRKLVSRQGTNKGYEQVFQPWYRAWEYTHHMVAREYLGRPLADGEQEVVHHEDENPRNNAPKNLTYMGKGAHLRHHVQPGRRQNAFTKELNEVRAKFTARWMRQIAADPARAASHAAALSKGRRTYDWDQPTREIRDSGLNLYDVAALLQAGVHQTWLSDLLGVDGTTVRRWVEGAGLNSTPLTATSPLRREALCSFFAAEFGADIEALYGEFCAGVGYSELQRRYGIDRSTIRDWFDRLGLETNRAAAIVRATGQSPEGLFEQYQAGEVSKVQIQRETGISPHMLNRLFERVEEGSLPEPIAVNHRILSIEADGCEDVFDIEVPATHNFALAAGLFVHNSHVRAGLARLDHSKLSASQKATVGNCLRRKGKALGMTFDTKKEAADGSIRNEFAACLVDSEHQKQIHLYALPADTTALEAVLAQFEQMPHTPTEKAAIVSRLAAQARAFLEAGDWQQRFGEVAVCEDGDAVNIPLTPENYGLLYAAMEAGLTPVSTAPAAVETPAATEPETTESAVTEPETAPETRLLVPPPTPTVDEAAVTTAAAAHAEAVARDLAGLDYEKQVARLKEAVAEAHSAMVVETQKTSQALAYSCALFMRLLQKPASRGKSVEALAVEMAVRSTSSLADKLTDLCAEYDAGGSAALALPRLSDPTVPEAGGFGGRPATPTEEAALRDGQPVDLPSGIRLTSLEELPLEDGDPAVYRHSPILADLFGIKGTLPAPSTSATD